MSSSLIKVGIGEATREVSQQEYTTLKQLSDKFHTDFNAAQLLYENEKKNDYGTQNPTVIAKIEQAHQAVKKLKSVIVRVTGLSDKGNEIVKLTMHNSDAQQWLKDHPYKK